MNVVLAQMSAAQKISLKLIRAYQGATAGRHRVCRFEPTCSVYASEAIGEFGFWKGWAYALRRLGRCRPLGGHGYDPVPQRKAAASEGAIRGGAASAAASPAASGEATRQPAMKEGADV